MRSEDAALTGTRVTSVDFFRYTPPARNMSSPACGLVVRLRASGGRNATYGCGEAVVSRSDAPAAWEQLARLAPQLVGTSLPRIVDQYDPLRGVRGWRPVGKRDKAAARAAKLALEMAILDLMIKVGRRPFGEAWQSAGRDRALTQPIFRMPPTPPGSSRDTVTAKLRADPGESWAVKLVATGEADIDIAWLRRAAEVERDAGRMRPMWLVCGGLDTQSARDLVIRVAKEIEAGLGTQVLLEEPLSARRRNVLSWSRWCAALIDLQELADSVLGQARDASGDRKLALVAGEGVDNLARLKRLCADRAIGAINFLVPRWGTLVGIRMAARAAKEACPRVLTLLTGGNCGELASRAIETFAGTTPYIDRYVLEPSLGWPTIVAKPEQMGLPSGTGLVPGVDLSELAYHVDRVGGVPLVEAPSGEPPPNEYPERRASLGTWDARATSLIEAELLKAGLRTRRLSQRLLLAEAAGSTLSVGFDKARSSSTSIPGFAIAANKGLTRDVLEMAGLPVADGAHFRSTEREEAFKKGIELGFPLVVKPGGGTKGIGVTTGISTQEELRQAIDAVLSSKYAKSGLILERQMSGNDYRILATPERVLSVVRREPAFVTGDGYHTVEELVVRANALRRLNPNLGKIPIPLDYRADEPLRQQGLTRQSVPNAGQRVRLSSVANLSQGGVSYEVLDSTHPSVSELAVAAVRAVGLPYAGLDVMMEDHQKPVGEQDLAIIEVNSIPMLAMHHYPMYGPPRNVSGTVVECVVNAAGLPMTTGKDPLSVHMTVRGNFGRTDYRQWVKRTARNLGLDCDTSKGASPEEMSAKVRGASDRIALLLRAAFAGPAGAEVVEVSAEPLDRVMPGVPRPRPVGAQTSRIQFRERSRASRSPSSVRKVRAAGARLIVEAARRRGIPYQKFTHGVTLVGDSGSRLAFRGLNGPTSSTVAELLCGNDAWLRRHLAVRNIPVRSTRLVGAADPDFAYAAALDVGLPLAIRSAGDTRRTQGYIVKDHDSFHKAWQEFIDNRGETRTPAILEALLDDALVYEVAVVGQEVVAVDSPTPEPEGQLVAEIAELSARTISSLPGARYGAVTVLVQEADSGRRAVVDSVDLLLSSWASGDGAASQAVADAILSAELGKAQTAST